MATSSSPTITTLSNPRKEEAPEAPKEVQEVETIKIKEEVITRVLRRHLSHLPLSS
jgi:hypothetical protein